MWKRGGYHCCENDVYEPTVVMTTNVSFTQHVCLSLYRVPETTQVLEWSHGNQGKQVE